MREGMQKELNAKNTPTIIYHDLYQGNDFHSIENYHLREREILAAKHRASHEIFRSKFLAALHWEGKHRDTNICEEEDMREDMEEIICDHEEMLVSYFHDFYPYFRCWPSYFQSPNIDFATGRDA